MSNHSLPARGTDPPFSNKSVVSITHEQNIIYSKTLICRQLFAGHVVSSRPMKRKEKIHQMMLIVVCLPQWELKILPSVPCILYCKLNLWGIWLLPFEHLSPNLQHFRDLQKNIHISIILQILCNHTPRRWQSEIKSGGGGLNWTFHFYQPPPNVFISNLVQTLGKTSGSHFLSQVATVKCIVPPSPYPHIDVSSVISKYNTCLGLSQSNIG